ncbi:MAG: HDOD domain-containing protein, partial [Pseudorhodobacter sp.]|nr:HDOD domain-containing protein [Frankiaceae bacterium]
IVDRDGRLTGNELLFRGGYDVPFDGERATASVLVTAACDIGWDRLGGTTDLYINVDHPSMLDRVLQTAPTERTVIELVESLVVDDDLVERMMLLRAGGLRLALDDFVPGSPAERLLPLVDVVKLDVLQTPPSRELGALIERLHAIGLVVLAEKVEDEQVHLACLELGFDLFQGYWYGRPTTRRDTALSPTRMLCLRLLGLLADESPDLDEIERVIGSDPVLIVRTLRMANSAAIGSAHRISSVRQAVVLVGPRVLSGWTALMLLAEDQHNSGDLVQILVQARTCETLARRDHRGLAEEAFLCGLVSAMSRRLGTDPGLLLRQIGATDQMQAALGQGAGQLGVIVRDVEAHLLGVDAGVHVELAHLAALAWTNELTQLDAG